MTRKREKKNTSNEKNKINPQSYQSESENETKKNWILQIARMTNDKRHALDKRKMTDFFF